MFSTILSLLLALFKAIPVLKKSWDEFVVYYTERQLVAMKAENIEAIRKAIYEHDQREIEKAMGNPNAGKEVPQPDSEIVDSVPGVP